MRNLIGLTSIRRVRVAVLPLVFALVLSGPASGQCPPPSPILGSVDTPGNALDVAVSGGVAYVTDSQSGLQVIDVSDPLNPAILGSVDTPDRAYGIAVSGDVAHVADREAGLQVIDVSDPRNPVILGYVDTPGRALGVAVSGDVAYVADSGSGLQVIDVSDPVNPTVLGFVDTPGNALDVVVAGEVAYVADGSSLQVIDVSDPMNPVILGSVDTPGSANDVAVAGDVAYVAGGHSGLQVIDVSDPRNPAILGFIEMPGAALAVAVSGDVVYVADDGFGLYVIDVSDPLNPALLGGVDTPGSAQGVAVSGDVAYVADHLSGLQVIDVSDPANPALLVAVDTPGEAWGVAVSGDVVYVADDAFGLQVIDVSDPLNPALLGGVDTPGEAWGVAVSGDVAYVADRYSGLQVIDVSDPLNPAILGAVDTPGSAQGVAVSGDVAYVADGDSGLQVIDVSDPANPSIIGSVDTIGSLAVDVSDALAYLVGFHNEFYYGLDVIDVSDPTNPTIVGSVDTQDVASGVFVAGDFAYVTDISFGLQVIDVSDPTNPVIVGSLDTQYAAVDVSVSGTVAYVIATESGLHVIDVSDPTSPALLGLVDTPGAALAVAVSGDVVYVADEAFGLQVIDVSTCLPSSAMMTLVTELVDPVAEGWNVDGYDVSAFDTHRVYAVFDEPVSVVGVGDAFADGIVFDSALSSGQFYNDPIGSDLPPNSALTESFPGMKWDTFVTIGEVTGLGGGGAPMTELSPEFTMQANGLEGAFSLDGTGWYVSGYPPHADAVLDATTGSYRVLIGQFTVDQGAQITGTNWRISANAGGQGGELFHLFGDFVTPDAPDPCPADFDGSGSVRFGDLTVLLSAWGPCGVICDCMPNDTGWRNESLGTLSGNLTLEFDHTPLAAPTDAVVALGLNPPPDPTFDDYAVLVRLDVGGYYDVRNGNTYSADALVPYTAGETYHIRVEADIPANTYSVWITPEGGVETLLASDYAFRTPQQGITALDTVALWADFADQHVVCDVAYGTGGTLGSCPCIPDLDGNGSVGFADLTMLITQWGPCPE